MLIDYEHTYKLSTYFDAVSSTLNTGSVSEFLDFQ